MPQSRHLRSMLNILIVYSCNLFPLRATTWNHLYCFKKYSGQRCFYLNVGVWDIPRYVWRIPFDLIVFDTLFSCTRWSRAVFQRNVEKVLPLKKIEAVRAILPQDEFISADILCDFINQMGIDVIFSVAPPSEWPKIYARVSDSRTEFHRVLTGYLDEGVVRRIKKRERRSSVRAIDIGYKTAGRPYFWFGRHGYLKQEIAERFQQKAPQRGLLIDISTRNEDTILGDRWFDFLLNCKYTIGTEGGTSILDWDGEIHERTTQYTGVHPEADFEEVEAACFPGLDGTLELFAISPRHLEACATRTCQVLAKGTYNGILSPGKHYIELEKDFSNIDEVLDIIAEDRLRAEITERAYEDIVASERFTYRKFVEFVIRHSLPHKKQEFAESFRSVA